MLRPLVLAVALAAWPTLATADDDKAVTFGAIFNATGPQAAFDRPSLNGARLAAEHLNANGGAANHRVVLAIAEGDSVPDHWPARVDALAGTNPALAAYFGLSDTDNVLEAARASARLSRVFLTSGATSPKLPDQVPQYLFLACFGDNVQAAVAAEWAFETKGARRALVLYDDTQTYPTLLQGYFSERFTELGGTVTDTVAIDLSANDPDIPDASGVDLVFLSVETAQNAVRIIPLLRAAGYDGPILGGDGYDAASFWAAYPVIANVFFTTHVYLGEDNPNPAVGAFIEAYQSAYQGEIPTGFSALGYDTVGLLAAAVGQSGAATPEGVLTGLAKVTSYAGVTGTISFADGAHIPKKSVTILEVSNGAQTFVEDRMPTKVPAP